MEFFKKLFAQKKREEKAEIITLFLCDCEGQISFPKDLELGEDVKVVRSSKLCSDEGKSEVLSAKGKVVIAGCTERVASKYFEAASPIYVNVREQGAFVQASTQKMKDLILSGVCAARKREEVKRTFPIKNKACLVIGAGVSGLEVASTIASAGIKTYLLEREPFVGGFVAKLDRLYPEGTPNAHTLGALIKNAVRNDVEILVSCTVKSVEGSCGDYKVKVMQRRNIVEGCTLCGKCVSACPVEVDDKGMMRKAIYYVPTHPDAYALDAQNCTKCGRCKEVCEKINLGMEEEEKVLEVGAVVVATGLSPYDATLLTPYGYGKYEGVMTALEFERRVAYQDFMPKRCVIIGCAGSRDEAHLSYCSRVCCLIALKEAKLLKDKVPDAEVYLTYIDMRSYGELEQFYTTLRNTYGVCFIEGRPAEVTQRDGHLVVHTEDLQLGRSLQIETDCVVLSVGFCPDKEVLDLLKIQTNNGFPTHYVHATRSSDSNLRGIYFVGAASFPKAVAECMAEAREVGGQVVSLLRRDEALFTTPVASINADICAQINCKICLSTCPYGAIKEEEEEKLSVDPSICMGCGICTATCAAGANELEGASTAQILAQIETLAKEGTVLALLCRWSAYPAADLAGYMQLRYPDEVRIVQVPCTGRVDGAMILKAFSLGAKAVLLGGCYPDACHYVSGNFKARKREMAVAELLQQFGIQKERVRIEWIGKAEAKKLVRILNQLAR